MKKDPLVVSHMREQERLGLLNCSIQNNCEEFDIKEAKSNEISDESIFFNDKDLVEDFDNVNAMPVDFESLKKEIIDLRKKYKKTKEKLEETENKYFSLAEYFEVITDTTVAQGKKDLFSDVSDIIFQLKPDGKITYLNTAVKKITGYNSSEMIGCDISKIIPQVDWKKLKKKLFPFFDKNNGINNEINNFESIIFHQNGQRIPVEINGKVISHGRELLGKEAKIRIQGSIRDVTERKKAEEERIKHAKRLEEMNEELKSLNEELTEAQDELRVFNESLEKKVEDRTNEIAKLLKRKDEFIGQLGHDLKSPLTPLVGLLPYVKECEKDPELKKLLDVANHNVKYMSDLVVKTLHLERLNLPNFKLILENLNLSESIDKIILNKKYECEEKNIKIKNNIDKKISIKADRLQFAELIDNLFINSIKFTPDGGEITFNAKKERDFIKISIKDNGVGLTSEQIEHIYDEFYKVDPSRHDLESSGLGLSICKRIVEKHGGNIYTESIGLGKGTTVSFTIPTN